jgi:L-lactate permease
MLTVGQMTRVSLTVVVARVVGMIVVIVGEIVVRWMEVWMQWQWMSSIVLFVGGDDSIVSLIIMMHIGVQWCSLTPPTTRMFPQWTAQELKQPPCKETEARSSACIIGWERGD